MAQVGVGGVMGHRDRVLSLYRQLFRLARHWQSSTGAARDTQGEKTYIQEEARRLFRKNKQLTCLEDIEEHIRECETRIQLAQHYRTPYPRPVNIPQNTLPPTRHRMQRVQQRSIQQSRPVYLKSYDDFNS